MRRSPKVVRPDLAPDLLGEGRGREQIGAGGLHVVSDRGELVGQGVEDLVEMGLDRAQP